MTRDKGPGTNQSSSLSPHQADKVTAPESSKKRDTLILLDLSGDKKAALEWADRNLGDYAIQAVDKADLKWKSKRDALAEIRAARPRAFVIFTSDIEAQSARGAMILFATLSGARHIVFADRRGKTILRSRLGALFVEAPRLALELLFGYAVIVPLSWILTAALGAMLGLRRVMRASQSHARNKDAGDNKKLTALYVRATIVPSSASAGGMASHVRGFTGGALALGHRLKFIASSNAGVDEAKVDLKVLKPTTAVSATRALFELWNNLVFTFRSLQHATEIDSGEVDFIYQRYSRFNWTGVALSLVTGLPLLLEYNGSEVWMARHWDPVGQIGLLKRFERLNQRAADFIFVVSEVERHNLICAGVDSSKVIVNPNGVDASEFRKDCGGTDVRRALGMNEKIVVGFVGTFGPWHGAIVLAEAALRINDAARLHFLLVGDGDQRSTTESIMASSGGRAVATFTGRIAHNEVAAYLDACDILVAPLVPAADGSEFFGSPTKLFEYMAMAKSVVASRLGQVADVIDDGENGLLIEPGDADALARAIERLAIDETLRARLGAAARKTVIENYTWQHNAQRVFEAVNDLK